MKKRLLFLIFLIMLSLFNIKDIAFADEDVGDGNTCSITIKQGEHGKFRVRTDDENIDSDTSVPYGTVIYLSNTPDEYFEFGNYTINGEIYTGSEFRVKNDIEISAVFIAKKYPVNLKNQGNGTVTTDTGSQVSAGSTVKVTITPDRGYEITRVLVNGNDVTSQVDENGILETDDTWGGLSVTANFEKITYSITTSSSSGGSIICYERVKYGDNLYVTFVPDTGYVIDRVLIDGKEVYVTNNTYALYNIDSNHDINVEFKEKYCVISVDSGLFGSASAGCTLKYGSSYTLKVYPDEGYQIDEIFVDGIPVYAKDNKFTISKVTKDIDIKVAFEENEIAKSEITSVTSTGVYSILVKWEKINRAEGYELYRKKTGSDAYEMIADLNTGYFEQSYEDKERECGTKYTYKVRAYRIRHGEKLYGLYSDAKTGYSRPQVVKSVETKALSISSIEIKWSEVQDVYGYEVYISDNIDGEYKLCAVTKGQNKCSSKIGNLLTGTSYYIKVRAIVRTKKGSVGGDFSPIKKKTTAFLTDVTGLKVENYKLRYALLSWDIKGGADGYKIFWSATPNGKFEKIATISKGSKSSYKDKYHFSGMNYYKVRAYKFVDGKKRYSCFSKVAEVDMVIPV